MSGSRNKGGPFSPPTGLASALEGRHAGVIETLLTLEPLEIALARFEEERRLVDAALQDRLPHSLRGRVGEIAADITDGVRHQILPAVLDLLAEQDRVSRALGQQFAARFPLPESVPQLLDGESEGPFAAPGCYERLRLSFKLLFITVRSMQNALNVCCAWLIHGERPSAKKASMEYTVGHPDSELGTLIAEQLTDYGPWFARWRAQRNRVKDGTGFGFFALDGDAGIQFTMLTDENVYRVDLSQSRVGLGDVAEALDRTSDVMEFVRQLASESDASS